jgi:uncharacterized protein (TIGR00269 family)
MDKVEQKVKQTIEKYKLFTKKDKILVASSGGKDSTTALYILNKLGYNPEAIAVDPEIGDYTKNNIENLKGFCKAYNIRLKVVLFREEFGYSVCYIKSLLESKGINLNSCTICGVLRRYLLNKYARKLKADVIATGHNLDDEAQAVMMNLFKNNLEILSRQGPMSGTNFDKKLVPRIKPLYFVEEKDIVEYSKSHNFPVKYGTCPCRTGVYRCTIDELLSKYEEKHRGTHKNIIKWFLRILPELKKKYKSSDKQAYCSNCGEPARKEVCMTCQILSKIKG